MTEPTKMQKMGATPGKLALVGVLAAVLIAVIVGQLPESQDTTELVRRRPTPLQQQPQGQNNTNPSQNIEKRKLTNGANEKQETAPRTWTELSLDSVVAFDPLATPDWLITANQATPDDGNADYHTTEAERQARKAEVLKKLQEQGTKIVVISSGEKRATIGELSVRIGDQIEGFVITDITKQGVVLSELEQQ